MLLDTPVRSQPFVEDCEICCCYPIEVHYAVQDGGVSDFEARVLE
jgi:hypothetical protein